MATEEEKAAQELQERVMLGMQAIARLNQQEKLANTRKQRIELTLAELTALPDGTSMYRSVGKAYFASSKDVLVKDAKEAVGVLTQEAETLRKQRTTVEQKCIEAQGELKELVQGMKALKA